MIYFFGGCHNNPASFQTSAYLLLSFIFHKKFYFNHVLARSFISISPFTHSFIPDQRGVFHHDDDDDDDDDDNDDVVNGDGGN